MLRLERPGRCYPAAVPVEPVIAYFGRFVLLTETAAILEQALPESQMLGYFVTSKSLLSLNVGLAACLWAVCR